jgi:hypothetical protein
MIWRLAKAWGIGWLLVIGLTVLERTLGIIKTSRNNVEFDLIFYLVASLLFGSSAFLFVGRRGLSKG